MIKLIKKLKNMKEFNFKKFTNRGARTGAYTISLNASNNFGFNSQFYNKESINKYKKVVLFYDPANNAVGFQFTNDEKAEGSFAIIHHKGTGAVACRSFILENKLNNKEYYGKKIPFKVETEQYGQLFVVNLEQEEKKE